MMLTTDQLSLVNAAVANLQRAYGETPEVPQGALDKYAKEAGLRFTVAHKDGYRYLSVNNGILLVEVGSAVGGAQPTGPNAGAGDGTEVLLQKAA